jgi:hypothetical protein
VAARFSHVFVDFGRFSGILRRHDQKHNSAVCTFYLSRFVIDEFRPVFRAHPDEARQFFDRF